MNIYVAENLQIIMQSTFPGVLTGKNCIGGVGTIFQTQLDPRSESTILSIIVLTII